MLRGDIVFQLWVSSRTEWSPLPTKAFPEISGSGASSEHTAGLYIARSLLVTVVEKTSAENSIATFGDFNVLHGNKSLAPNNVRASVVGARMQGKLRQ